MLMAKYAGETITESYWTSSLYKVFFRGYSKVTTTLGFDLRFRWKKKNRRLHFWVCRTVTRKQEKYTDPSLIAELRKAGWNGLHPLHISQCGLESL